MQLFIIEAPIHSTKVMLTDSWILHQIGRVLRMKAGDVVSLQWEDSWQTTRWLYTILQLSKKTIELELNWELQTKQIPSHKVRLAVALPNKRSKAELIVQKLTEIGVWEIIRFVAQRSQYKSIPDKKLQRMNEIVREATEQSRGWQRTQINYCKSLGDVLVWSWGKIWVCDIVGKSEVGNQRSEEQSKTILIWPEWWWGPQDYEILGQYEYGLLDLWDRVLRMETAAIIAGWRGMNDMK